MKKRTVIALLLALVMALCSFSVVLADEAAPAEAAPAGIETPFIVTSCGQSPGAVMLNNVARMASLTAMVDNALTADTLAAMEPGVYKTLIITTGTSGKGMGAAGTDVDAEIARCVAAAEKAHELGMTVVCAHIEGAARRTDSADQASIDNILAVCDVILVVEESNSDNLFSDFAAAHNLPIYISAQALDLKEHLY